MWFNYLKITNKQTELKKSLDAISTWFKKHVTFIILNKFALPQEIPVTKAIFTLKWIRFVSSWNPYRIGILFLQEASVWALFCGSADSCGDARKREVAFCRGCLCNSAVHKNNYRSCKVWTKTRPTIGCFSTYSRAFANLVPRFSLLPVLSRSVVTGRREPWERGWRIRHFRNKKRTGRPQLFRNHYWGRACHLI